MLVELNVSVYEKNFLEMADLAIANGADPKAIAKIAENLGFILCVWCKERGNYPSSYLKKADYFKNGMSDAWMDGKVCDECITKGSNFNY